MKISIWNFNLKSTFSPLFQTDTMFKWLFIFNEVLSIICFHRWTQNRFASIQYVGKIQSDFPIRKIFNLKMSNESHSLGDRLDAPDEATTCMRDHRCAQIKRLNRSI